MHIFCLRSFFCIFTYIYIYPLCLIIFVLFHWGFKSAPFPPPSPKSCIISFHRASELTTTPVFPWHLVYSTQTKRLRPLVECTDCFIDIVQHGLAKSSKLSLSKTCPPEKSSTTGTERTTTSHDESTEEESQSTETHNNEEITNALSFKTCGQCTVVLERNKSRRSWLPLPPAPPPSLPQHVDTITETEHACSTNACASHQRS